MRQSIVQQQTTVENQSRMEQRSDQELISLYRDPATRHQAFNAIMLRYQEKLYWYIRRMVTDHDDANDVIQNAFVKAWKGLENFREEANLYTWLYRVATNEAYSFLKKKNRHTFVSMEDAAQHLAGNLESDTWYSGDEIQRKLQAAVASLPDKQRAVFTLKYFEEKKYQEMSEILDTSVGALKASYHHAVKKIEKFLKVD